MEQQCGRLPLAVEASSCATGSSAHCHAGLLPRRRLLLLLAGGVPLLGHALQAGRQVLTAVQVDAQAAVLAAAVPRVVLQQAKQAEGAHLNMQLGRGPGMCNAQQSHGNYAQPPPSVQNRWRSTACAAHLVQSIQRVVGPHPQHLEEALKIDLLRICKWGGGARNKRGGQEAIGKQLSRLQIVKLNNSHCRRHRHRHHHRHLCLPSSCHPPRHTGSTHPRTGLQQGIFNNRAHI